jgi:hypothetical protein
MLRNFLGLFIGLVIINSIAFLVSYFMQAEQGITAMFLACFGSFFSFIGSQFLPIPLLKRIFGLGLVVGFIGSFLTGLFHNNYVVAQYLNTFKSVPTFSVTQKPKIDTSKVYYFKLADYKILTDNQTKYTKRSRTDTKYYYITPIVATNETQNDSIFWWFGFEYHESLGGESYKDYMNYALSNKALANIVLDSYDSLNFAAAIDKATWQHNLKTSKSYLVLEMTDTQMKEDFSKQQFQYTLFLINALWLLVGLFVIFKLRNT